MSGQYFEDDGVRGDGAAGDGALGADGGGVKGASGDEVAAYAAEVRAALADLTSEQSTDLLDDLEDHLREVAAEDSGDLRTRLGAPADYARELRISAGLDPEPDAGAVAGGGSTRDSGGTGGARGSRRVRRQSHLDS